MRTYHVRLVAVAIAITALSAFTTAWASTPKILVIPKAIRVQYWQGLRDGAEQAGKDLGAKIIYRGPRTSIDHEAQLGILASGIEENVDAILLAPNHTSKASPILKKAQQSGIKVIIVDSDMDFSLRESFVASDNIQAGKQAADHLLSLLPEGSTILMLRFQQDHASTVDREKGFLAQVRASDRGIKILDAGFVGISVGEAYHSTLILLKNNPNINALFAPMENLTIGAAKALQESGRGGEIKAVGFDYTPEISEALNQGLLHGTIVQDPYQMGYKGVAAALAAIEGTPVPSRIVTSTTIITKENNSPDNPLLKIFLQSH